MGMSLSSLELIPITAVLDGEWVGNVVIFPSTVLSALELGLPNVSYRFFLDAFARFLEKTGPSSLFELNGRRVGEFGDRGALSLLRQRQHDSLEAPEPPTIFTNPGSLRRRLRCGKRCCITETIRP